MSEAPNRDWVSSQKQPKPSHVGQNRGARNSRAWKANAKNLFRVTQKTIDGVDIVFGEGAGSGFEIQ